MLETREDGRQETEEEDPENEAASVMFESTPSSKE